MHMFIIINNKTPQVKILRSFNHEIVHSEYKDAVSLARYILQILVFSIDQSYTIIKCLSI